MDQPDPAGASGGQNDHAASAGASGGPSGADATAADHAAAGAANAGAGPDGVDAADGPQPLGVGVRATGVPGVDTLLERLGDVDHLTVPGHLEVYEDVHQRLREALTALDRAPGPVPSGVPHGTGS